MDPATTFLIGGSQKTVQGAFNNLFESLAGQARAWQDLRLLTRDSGAKYADLIERRVGHFPLFATTKTAPISKAYARVAISSKISHEVYRSEDELIAELLSQRIGRQARDESALEPLHAIDKSQSGFALLGSAGSGKTTIFRHICHYLANGGALRGKPRLPLYIAVRDMRSAITPVKAFEKFLLSIDVKEPSRVLQALLSSGNIAILVDGLDETDLESQERILQEIEDIQIKYRDAIVCVSARPHSLSRGIAHFEKWETINLSHDERIQFASNWFSCVDDSRISGFLEACQLSPTILDLGSNPLLLSLVCALYYNELNVPKEPTELLSRAVEGMVGGWDNFRAISRTGPLAAVSIAKRVAIATHLAAGLFDKGKIVFSESDMIGLNNLKQIEERFRISLPDNEVLLNILSADFGILIERAKGLFSFSHLTLQEYLCARYIVEHRRERQLLAGYLRNTAWREVIVFVSKLLPDPDDFLNTLLQSLGSPRGADFILLHRIFGIYPNCSDRIYHIAANAVIASLGLSLRSIPGEFTRTDDMLFYRPSSSRIDTSHLPAIGSRRDHRAALQPSDFDGEQKAEARRKAMKAKDRRKMDHSKQKSLHISRSASDSPLNFLREIANILIDTQYQNPTPQVNSIFDDEGPVRRFVEILIARRPLGELRFQVIEY